MNAKDTLSKRSNTVLFAIGDEPVQAFLAAALPLYDFQYNTHFVITLSEAHQWLSRHAPCCVVMTVSLALAPTGDSTKLIDTVPPHIPIISLVDRATGYPDYLYTRGNLHTWCTMPFDVEEIIGRIYSLVEETRNMDSGNLQITGKI